MISQRAQVQSIDAQIKKLKETLKNAEKPNLALLYKEEEIIFMKRSLRTLCNTREKIRQIQNGGFGYDV